VSDSQLEAECERVEAQYLEDQWGPLSDCELLDYVRQIEDQMERKRIADMESENESGILIIYLNLLETENRSNILS